MEEVLFALLLVSYRDQFVASNGLENFEPSYTSSLRDALCVR